MQDLRGRLSRSRGGAVGALRNPLYRSGYALLANTAGTTVVGVAFWAVAAHLYSRQVVGRSSALITALILVSSLAQLNLINALPRFLPKAGPRAAHFITYCYAASAIAALVGGVAFVVTLPSLNSQWRFVDDSASLAVMFVAATVVWGVFALQDAALTGLHRAVIVPLENTAYGVLKLLLLVGLAGLLRSTGIFVSWVIPLAVTVPAVNWLIFRRYVKNSAFADATPQLRARKVVHHASIDYVGALFAQAYANVPPLLVLSILGAAANGNFYIAWTIGAGLQLVAVNFGMSLLVEGAAAPHRLAELTRGVLIRCAVVTVPGALVLTLAARPILKIYGSEYALHASTLLALLALASIPRCVVMVSWSLDRIESRVGRAAWTQLSLTVLVLGGSWVLLRHFGTDGVGLAWLGGNLAVAAVRFPTIARVIRRPAATTPVAPVAERARAEQAPADTAELLTQPHTSID